MALEFHATSKFVTIGAAAVAAMTSAVLVHPGIARADSSAGTTASSLAPTRAGETDTFKLTALTPSALLSNAGRGQLQICNETGRRSVLDEASAMPPFTSSGSSTLEVSYNGKTEQIMPGQCDRMNARHVRITTNEPLGPRSDLKGTVARVAPADLIRVSNGMVGNSAEPVGIEINEMRSELKQDDRTTRQATAELKQASRELRLAARDLRGQPMA